MAFHEIDQAQEHYDIAETKFGHSVTAKHIELKREILKLRNHMGYKPFVYLTFLFVVVSFPGVTELCSLTSSYCSSISYHYKSSSIRYHYKKDEAIMGIFVHLLFFSGSNTSVI